MSGRRVRSKAVVGAADAAALAALLLRMTHLPPVTIPPHHAWVAILLVGWHSVDDPIVSLYEHAETRALCAARRHADQSHSLRAAIELGLQHSAAAEANVGAS